MQNLLNDLKGLLQQDERLVVDGKLLKNKIIELALQLDPSLLKMLLMDASIKKHFFQEVDKVLVFDKIKFQKFISNKEFLPDSYTSFKNKIGLVGDYEYISESKEVVLVWPYKDCVLEAGQSSEKQVKTEKFWNSVLAPNDIDRLMSPKSFASFLKIESTNETIPKQLNRNDNFLIKGNNLAVLCSLLKRFQNSIKQIYIDPPYNTGKDGFNYNDKFNHSTWLTFMKTRLEISRELLSNQGMIWISIDSNESHYLKILCDEIFGRENFIEEIIWQRAFSPVNLKKFFSRSHDSIIVYAKNLSLIPELNKLSRTEEADNRYKNPDKDPRGLWTSGDLSVGPEIKEKVYPIETPSGRIVFPPKSYCWRVSKDKFNELVKDNRIWFGENGDNVPRLKRFLSEVKEGITPMSLWLRSEVGDNQDAKREIKKMFNEDIFETPKPEKLMQRIIELGTNEGDIVLDFFGGSGTTCAVAHKLKRQWICIEQMDYIETLTKNRLKQVLTGDEGGISKDVKWTGGGNFIYCELKDFGSELINKIVSSESLSKLKVIAKNLKTYSFIDYRFELNNIDSLFESSLTLEEIKQILIEVIDKNLLYLPYTELTDKDFNVSSDMIDLNHKFYNL